MNTKFAVSKTGEKFKEVKKIIKEFQPGICERKIY